MAFRPICLMPAGALIFERTSQRVPPPAVNSTALHIRYMTRQGLPIVTRNPCSIGPAKEACCRSSGAARLPDHDAKEGGTHQQSPRTENCRKLQASAQRENETHHGDQRRHHKLPSNIRKRVHHEQRTVMSAPSRNRSARNARKGPSNHDKIRLLKRRN